MHPVIRAATQADKEHIFALLKTQLSEHAIQPPDVALRRAIDRLLFTPEIGRILVATLDGEIAGVAVVALGSSVERGGQSAWLEELYVDPARRGAGLGARLVRAARDTAAAAGANAIDLEVEEGHERAAHLYEREGFVRLARQHFTLELTPTPAAPPPALASYEGGCLCGAVRYRASAPPFEVSHCHCSFCRRSSGAPFVTWATFRSADFGVTAGTPRERFSTRTCARTFCGDCGTALTFRDTAEPASIDVAVGSLDRPDAVEPGEHIWVTTMLSWLRLADGLPRYAERGERHA